MTNFQQINLSAKIFLHGKDNRSEAQTDEVKWVLHQAKPPKQQILMTLAITRSFTLATL